MTLVCRKQSAIRKGSPLDHFWKEVASSLKVHTPQVEGCDLRSRLSVLLWRCPALPV